LSFTTPQAWIGVDYPGLLRIELFSAGRLIFTSNTHGKFLGNFLGLISTELFDAAVLIDPAGDVFIDDLHFGVPAPGAVFLFGLAALCARRRRRA
ncbi:MAG: PEP-CTERM sorting domain-containing protein, partial [Planctomycetes bacterium]|nr:PEP-CTERM sorting domain-containing protein [Planctomycetota bacterium]